MDAQKISGLKIADSEQFSATRRRHGTLWIVIAAAAAAIVLYLFQAGLLTSATNVRTAGADWVYPSQVITQFNASGYVVAQRKASVASKGTGRIVYLGVQEGSRVKEGEVIARLDSDDLKAEKAQAEAQLVVAKFDLTRAETELGTAEANFKRLKELWGKKAAAQVDLENAQDRFFKAKTAIDSAKANINALQASVQRESVLIEYTIIRAPFDGVILTKDADVGEVVAPFGSATNAKAAVVSMADLSSLMVQADVGESFLSMVQSGQPCEIQLDAIPQSRFAGRVHMIVPTADRMRGTVMVKVRFDELDPRVLPEMSAKAAFLSRTLGPDENKPVLGVHRDALVSQRGGQGLFRVEKGQAEWVPIKDPQFLGDYLMIGPEFFGDHLMPAPPVKHGDRIVIKPPARLKPGDRVEISE
ncbi:MAG TPA: efflux RND transporter periplasmic adaptor subunit [Deltaproteobacteria bacterium]|jgi:RND family efflux transporter MFP subunit|nr:efflux RND transporter periplasmic adaptor subunit [Deltaproteobacteria bacterium]HIJ75674.1 efflux RND transporter periplasmic adaptor subunit [Deltaproteobacteria bacterium]